MKPFYFARIFISIQVLFPAILYAAISFSSPYGEVCKKSGTQFFDVAHLGTKFDSAFLSLSEEDALNLMISRIALLDPIKADDWRKGLKEQWLRRKTISGVILTSPLQSTNKCEFERSYIFQSGQFIVSMDIFDKLKGYEKAYIRLQAFLLERAVKENPELYLPWAVYEYPAFYFSTLANVKNYSEFIKILGNYLNHNGSTGAMIGEVQLGHRYYKYPIKFYPNTNQLLSAITSRSYLLDLATGAKVHIQDLSEVFFYNNGKEKLIYLKKPFRLSDIGNVFANILEFHPDGSIHGFALDNSSSQVLLSTENSGDQAFNRYDLQIIFIRNKKVYLVCEYDPTDITNRTCSPR